jgi:hypothetical protein
MEFSTTENFGFGRLVVSRRDREKHGKDGSTNRVGDYGKIWKKEMVLLPATFLGGGGYFDIIKGYIV